MRRTNEQLEYIDFLSIPSASPRCWGQAEAAGLRVRVVPDVEGFPIIPGGLGQVEYYGAEVPTGEQRLRSSQTRPGSSSGS